MTVKRPRSLKTPVLFGIIVSTVVSFAGLVSTSASAGEKHDESNHMVMMMTASHAANGLSIMSTMKIARLMNNLDQPVTISEISEGPTPVGNEMEALSADLPTNQTRHHTAYLVARTHDDIHNPQPENK
jgi:hypothetical protein